MVPEMTACFIFWGETVSKAFLRVSSVDPKFIKRSIRSVSSVSRSNRLWERGIEKLGTNAKRLDHKDWLAPNEVLKIFKSVRDPQMAFDLFQKLVRRKDYKPNEALYTILIEMLASAKKFDAIEELLTRMKMEKCKLSDEFFRHLIKLYANIGKNAVQAVNILYRMPDFHCWPSVRTFNSVLNMLVCAKQYEMVHEVYLSASQLGVAVDTCCFNILIKALCQCGDLDAAFSLLQEAPKQGCRPNATTYATLMHGLCKSGRVSEAFELYERMEREVCYPDTITFNILISGLCKQGSVKQAMDLLHTMKLKGCYPNSGSYQALIYGLLDASDFVEANKLLSLMVSKGIFPSFLSYKMLIDGLCDMDLLRDVDAVLTQMINQGFIPRMGTWMRILESLFRGRTCEDASRPSC
ncbi:pentatricopeptide repeat-containing protein At3g14580, mitochondrial isoform X2 [Amborella trichopoda]|nr:pentatricopeptide repeat-containing protein At3g14580, mitochondrial isoform X2 [Amborella trichopoda]|eukprot:XP_006849944.2 pentatricopeptide repeat-containing protein At3g14580, mitochondrial isoform X2 [Amborella trichopoda]